MHWNIVRSILFSFIIFTSDASECVPKDFGNGSPVCVCDSFKCDTVAQVEPMLDGTAVVYTSSKEGDRLKRRTLRWNHNVNSIIPDVNIKVDRLQKFQRIVGFGGAFTDSATMNIASLPYLAQQNLLYSYFGNNGIGYNLARVPIASCDFSLTNYSYDDVPGDFGLHHFAMNEADIRYKIPYIRQAMKISNKKLKLFASPWSAPFWMKTNQMMQGAIGTLIGPTDGPYYKTWANYFVKFLDDYAKRGVNFWALTIQNQPSNGFQSTFHAQSMGYTSQMERDFIKFNLGPALRNSTHKNVRLMVFDDQRYYLPKWVEPILNDPEAAKYVSYIAIHFYGNSNSPVQLLDEIHELYPQFPLLGTEACIIGPAGEKVVLGSWERAEEYAKDIIETLNNWYTGWTDWNLALDLEGGPNWISNFVDSPIIVNASSGEFYKQPMFYAMGHFSKFLPRDSVRIGMEMTTSEFYNTTSFLATAFRSSDNYNVIILLNRNNVSLTVTVMEKYRRSALSFEIPAFSIQSILWK